ncbi:gluzincin family metallopeptidase [Alicyclobacillus dauci]|uniref:Transposase IS66 family protein n=1 Tax=Alicyclobacillus dauci TaxID=1475485 RepID=A0ABY6YYS2_9BACL|nr:hypothetical protein [Alicyclobacillus dauci]WAH35418.1 hypothetical protein NZD86_14045 [Alicyclobacillus dauci]
MNLSQLGKFLNSPDRDVRQAANKAKYGFFSAHAEQLDHIYDGLVRARTTIAGKVGYRTFTKLGYARLKRTDYGPDEVSLFREQVKQRVVPLAEKLKERQRQWIGVDTLRYFDEGINFTSGNPAPKGNSEWILARGQQMYKELSRETDEFFNLCWTMSY